jgi:hypothetical protein
LSSSLDLCQVHWIFFKKTLIFCKLKKIFVKDHLTYRCKLPVGFKSFFRLATLPQNAISKSSLNQQHSSAFVTISLMLEIIHNGYLQKHLNNNSKAGSETREKQCGFFFRFRFESRFLLLE